MPYASFCFLTAKFLKHTHVKADKLEQACGYTFTFNNFFLTLALFYDNFAEFLILTH